MSEQATQAKATKPRAQKVTPAPTDANQVPTSEHADLPLAALSNKPGLYHVDSDTVLWRG